MQRQVVAVAVGQHGVKEHPAALGGAHPQATPAVGLGKRGGPTLLGGGNVQEQGQEPLVHHAGVAEVVVGLVLLAWVVPFCELGKGGGGRGLVTRAYPRVRIGKRE